MEPTLIVGPAIVGIGAQYIYVEGDITEKIVTQTEDLKMSLAGVWAKIMKSRSVTLSFTPAGMVDSDWQAAVFPWGPANIGTEVLASAGTVTIWTKAGQQIVYAKGAVSKAPAIMLGVAKNWLGSMELVCKSDPAKSYINASAWNAITALALADDSWDETKVKRGQVLLDWSIPPVAPSITPTVIFTGVGTVDGAQIDVQYKLENLQPDGFNIIGAILSEISYTAKFKPVGWAEADFYNYLNLQDAGALLPGELISKQGATLTASVATAGLTVALTNMGPSDGEQSYDLAGAKAYRTGEVVMHGRLSWTAGVINNPLTITIA